MVLIALVMQEDRDALLKELANLRHQLKALTGQHSSVEENISGLVHGLHEEEVREVEKKISFSDNPFHDMMNECSNFVRNALDLQLQKEETIREIQATLSMKDQEIKDLRAKVTELSIYLNSQDVVVSSYFLFGVGLILEKHNCRFVMNNIMLRLLQIGC